MKVDHAGRGCEGRDRGVIDDQFRQMGFLKNSRSLCFDFWLFNVHRLQFNRGRAIYSNDKRINHHSSLSHQGASRCNELINLKQDF